jgi:hypothetical protein
VKPKLVGISIDSKGPITLFSFIIKCLEATNSMDREAIASKDPKRALDVEVCRCIVGFATGFVVDVVDDDLSRGLVSIRLNGHRMIPLEVSRGSKTMDLEQR